MIWKKSSFINVRSAGTSPRARKTVQGSDIRWADIIFTMEKKHKNRLKAQFKRLVDFKPIHVLNIPDVYQFMDETLIVELKRAVAQFLDIEP